MNVVYCGEFGSAKTFMAVYDCVIDKGKNIWTNQPIDQEMVNALKKNPQKKEIKNFSEIHELTGEIMCGKVLLDEAQDSISSHERTKDIPESFRRLFRQQRKLDLDFVMTTHRIKDIAPYFRSTTREVRVCQIRSLPFVGFFFAKAVRPPVFCSECGEVMRDCDGDQSTFWRRIFGFGTLITYNAYSPDVIDAVGASDDGMEEYSLRKGFRLFDIDIANAYNTKYMVDKTHVCKK